MKKPTNRYYYYIFSYLCNHYYFTPNNFLLKCACCIRQILDKYLLLHLPSIHDEKISSYHYRYQSTFSEDVPICWYWLFYKFEKKYAGTLLKHNIYFAKHLIMMHRITFLKLLHLHCYKIYTFLETQFIKPFVVQNTISIFLMLVLCLFHTLFALHVLLQFLILNKQQHLFCNDIPQYVAYCKSVVIVFLNFLQ